MSASIKTAISIQQELFASINLLAEELQVSRSKLFAMAMEEFIEKTKNRKLLAQINAACSSESDAEEVQTQRLMQKKQRASVEREAW